MTSRLHVALFLLPILCFIVLFTHLLKAKLSHTYDSHYGPLNEHFSLSLSLGLLSGAVVYIFGAMGIYGNFYDKCLARKCQFLGAQLKSFGQHSWRARKEKIELS